jgi:ADP-ribosyltransferase exoenzyme
MGRAVERLAEKVALAIQVKAYLKRSPTGHIEPVVAHERTGAPAAPPGITPLKPLGPPPGGLLPAAPPKKAAKPKPSKLSEFTDEGQADTWARGIQGKWADEHREEMGKGVVDYAVTEYRWVNGSLRGDDALASRVKEWNEGEGYEDVTVAGAKKTAGRLIPQLDAAFASVPVLPEGVAVRRGGRLPPALKEGDEFTDPSFVSTSLTTGRADDFVSWAQEAGKEADNIRVEVPAGSKAIYVDALRGGERWESEMLLDRGLRYQVVSTNPPVLRVVGREER